MHRQLQGRSTIGRGKSFRRRECCRIWAFRHSLSAVGGGCWCWVLDFIFGWVLHCFVHVQFKHNKLDHKNIFACRVIRWLLKRRVVFFGDDTNFFKRRFLKKRTTFPGKTHYLSSKKKSFHSLLSHCPLLLSLVPVVLWSQGVMSKVDIFASLGYLLQTAREFFFSSRGSALFLPLGVCSSCAEGHFSCFWP